MLVRKVLSTRRATGFDTEANNWKGPCAAGAGGGGGVGGLAKVWGHALLENI